METNDPEKWKTPPPPRDGDLLVKVTVTTTTEQDRKAETQNQKPNCKIEQPTNSVVYNVMVGKRKNDKVVPRRGLILAQNWICL